MNDDKIDTLIKRCGAKPRCVCSPRVEGCVECTRIDWSKVQSPNGQASRDALLAEQYRRSNE